MDCTGRLVEVSKNWENNKFRLTYEVNEDVTGEVNSIKECEQLNISAKRFRKKRSLDANSYCWVLLQKLAEANKSDKWTMYLECLQRYSRAFTHIIVKEKAVKRMMEMYRTSIDLGEVTVNGQTGHQLQVYYGSSTFDSKEMSVFIDGIVSECKEHDIQTMTPAEIERMKASWQSS